MENHETTGLRADAERVFTALADRWCQTKGSDLSKVWIDEFTTALEGYGVPTASAAGDALRVLQFSLEPTAEDSAAFWVMTDLLGNLQPDQTMPMPGNIEHRRMVARLVLLDSNLEYIGGDDFTSAAGIRRKAVAA